MAETIEVRFQASLEAMGKDVLFPVETPLRCIWSTASGKVSRSIRSRCRWHKPRVLLVEDNENAQFLIENLLDMDITLGVGPNGADVFRERCAMPTYPDVPLAALTAYALPGDKERLLDRGFSA